MTRFDQQQYLTTLIRLLAIIIIAVVLAKIRIMITSIFTSRTTSSKNKKSVGRRLSENKKQQKLPHFSANGDNSVGTPNSSMVVNPSESHNVIMDHKHTISAVERPPTDRPPRRPPCGYNQKLSHFSTNGDMSVGTPNSSTVVNPPKSNNVFIDLRPADRPRRPPCGYNLFFHLQKERLSQYKIYDEDLLQSYDNDNQEEGWTVEEIAQAAHSLYHSPAKRKHGKKPGGSLPFHPLREYIAKKWKAMENTETRQLIEQQALSMRQDYHQALQQWKRANRKWLRNILENESQQQEQQQQQQGMMPDDWFQSYDPMSSGMIGMAEAGNANAHLHSPHHYLQNNEIMNTNTHQSLDVVLGNNFHNPNAASSSSSSSSSWNNEILSEMIQLERRNRVMMRRLMLQQQQIQMFLQNINNNNSNNNNNNNNNINDSTTTNNKYHHHH